MRSLLNPVRVVVITVNQLVRMSKIMEYIRQSILCATFIRVTVSITSLSSVEVKRSR